MKNCHLATYDPTKSWNQSFLFNNLSSAYLKPKFEDHV